MGTYDSKRLNVVGVTRYEDTNTICIPLFLLGQVKSKWIMSNPESTYQLLQGQTAFLPGHLKDSSSPSEWLSSRPQNFVLALGVTFLLALKTSSSPSEWLPSSPSKNSSSLSKSLSYTQIHTSACDILVLLLVGHSPSPHNNQSHLSSRSIAQPNHIDPRVQNNPKSTRHKKTTEKRLKIVYNISNKTYTIQESSTCTI